MTGNGMSFRESRTYLQLNAQVVNLLQSVDLLLHARHGRVENFLRTCVSSGIVILVCVGVRYLGLHGVLTLILFLLATSKTARHNQ